MKNFKRFISYCLVLLLMTVISPDYIAYADVADHVVLETIDAASAAVSVLKADTTVVRSYSHSAKWDKTDTDNKVVQLWFNPVLNITPYQFFNFWAYSEKATGSTINVAVFSTSRNESNRQGYLLKALNVDWTGWKLISLPLADFTQRYSPDLKTIERVDLDARQWNASDIPASPETVLYFEKIWFSAKIPSVSPWDPGVIAQFDTADSALLDKTGTLVLDSTIKKHYDWSAKWANLHTSQNAIVQLSLAGIDFTEYSHFAAWVYSEKATEATINIAAFSNSRNESNRQGYLQKGINVDWAGWRLISIPLADFTKRYEPDLTSMQRLDLDARKWADSDVAAGPDTVLYLEKIWLTNEGLEPCTLVSAEPAYGMDDIPVKNATVKFTYNNEMDEASISSAIQVSGGKSNPSYSVSIDGRVVLVAFDELEFDTSYTVKIGKTAKDSYGQAAKEASVTFTTMAKNLWAEIPVFESNEISATVYNPNSGEKAAQLNIVTFSEGGLNVNLVNKKVTVGGESSEEVKLEYTLSDGKTAKAYVTDENGSLLHSGYLFLDANGVRYEVPASLSGEGKSLLLLNRAAVENGKFIAEGTVSGKSPRTVLITIKNERNVVYQNILLTQNGAFRSEAEASGVEEGYYTIIASARCANEAKKEVHYLSETTRQDILNTANNATTVSAIMSLLNANRSALSIDNDADTEFLARTLLEQKPYADFWAVAAMVDKAQTLINQLNNCTFSTLSAFLTENHEIVLYGKDYYWNKYSTMSSDEQNKVNKKLTDQKYQNFVKFRDRFEEVLTPTKTNTGGSGGGSGSGNGSFYSFDNAGQKTPQTTPPEQDKTPGEVEVFTDIKDFAWAKEAILALYDKKIIAFPTDGRFRPADNITRAEFVKMIVQALGISPEGECTFTDVSSEHWSYPYLAAAQSHMIIKGSDDGSFGVNEPITRQDMAVMIYRAFAMNGVEGEPFADDGQIAPYAKEAVYALRAAGLINGMGDGKFVPLEYANRAQAAQVIFGLLEVEK